MLNKLINKNFFSGFLGTFTGVIFGIIVGIGTQYVTAWTAPPNPAPGGSVTAPLTTGAATQGKTGALGVGQTSVASGATLDVNGTLRTGNANGAYTYVALEDDESPNGVKYVHANSNVIGFLGGDGNWLSYITQAGDSYQKGNAGVTGYITAGGNISAGGNAYSAAMGAGHPGNTLTTKDYVDTKVAAAGGGGSLVNMYQCPGEVWLGGGAWGFYGCQGQLTPASSCHEIEWPTQAWFPCTYVGKIRLEP
ncbi:MAG: hypothetical protein RLZZ230_775 [Candidatus Parcubacteria bacterium]|jgi:hypothetical protein